MSLRLRINLVITLLTLAFTVGMAQVVIDDTRSSIREEMESATHVAVQLIETVVASVYREPGPAERNDALLALLQRLGRVRANEIRLYDASGNLLYESPPSTYRAGRSAPDWFTRLVGPKLGAARLLLPGGAIVVTPDPSRSIVEAWEGLQSFVALAAVFLALINIVIFALLHRALKPLPKILDGLDEMARGRFDTRLPDFPVREFGSLSRGFNRMTEALQTSLGQNRQLALVAQQSSDAILILDLRGHISYANAAAQRLLGYAESELVGAAAERIMPADRTPELRATLEAARRREYVELLQTQRLTKAGRLVDVALSAAPLVDPATGAVIGEICSMRDITEQMRRHAAETALEQNRRFTALVQARIEEERRAIARELHDELGQSVTAIRTIGTAIASQAGDGAPQIRENARTIVSVAAGLYDVVHNMIRRLRPSLLDHLGLGDTLRDAVADWAQRHPGVRWDLALRGELGGLGEAVNITVFRVVQEALTNVVRHAQATRAEIAVSRERNAAGVDAVIVEVRDNGRGFAPGAARPQDRFGLVGMRERAQACGGTFEISGPPGGGVTVRIVIPLTGVQPRTPLEA